MASLITKWGNTMVGWQSGLLQSLSGMVIQQERQDWVISTPISKRLEAVQDLLTSVAWGEGKAKELTHEYKPMSEDASL